MYNHKATKIPLSPARGVVLVAFLSELMKSEQCHPEGSVATRDLIFINERVKECRSDLGKYKFI